MKFNPAALSMNTNRMFAVLILLLGVSGAVAYELGHHFTAREAARTITINTQRPTLLQKKAGDTAWLWLPRRTERLLTLKTTPNALMDGHTGEVWFGYKTDTARRIRQATEPHRAKRRMARLLADPAQADTNLQWQEARLKLLKFVADEASKDGLERTVKDADALLFHRFLEKISSLQNRRRLIYLLDRELYTDPLESFPLEATQRLQLSAVPATPQDFSFWQWLAMGCWLAACAVGAAGWWRGAGVRSQESGDRSEESGDRNEEAEVMGEEVEAVNEDSGDRSEEPEFRSEEVDSRESSLQGSPDALSSIEKEQALVSEYAKQFYGRYGDLFEQLQKTSIPPTEAEREAILRQLVEMALHAHTFAYFGIMDKLGRLNESPNARLLLENKAVSQLPEDQRKVFTTDPYQTDAKYRALYELLKSLNIKQLNVLAEDRIYILEKFWENK